MQRTKIGFTHISKDEYVELFLKANPSDSRSAVAMRLDLVIAARSCGERCECGEPIWVVGSAEAGIGCFSCITGESTPDSDYEIAPESQV